jgi:hypothetical protein
MAIDTESPITVTFGKARIKPTGDVGSVTIVQGSETLILMPEQARSLAAGIRLRFGSD